MKLISTSCSITERSLMMEHIIEFNKVSKAYQVGSNKMYAVKDVSFTIDEGEFVIVLGPSGAGKSTILNLLGGMDYVSNGEIMVNGNNISKYNDNELTEYRAKNVGFVFQFYNLIPSLTAYENVNITKDLVKTAMDAEEVLTLVGLKEHMNQFPAQLSGGEQQRVSIARAIAKNPTMLLCDEPTGALDSETGVVVLDLLQKMSREHKKTVIIVTHNAALADAGDKVIRIKNGRVVEVKLNETPLSISEVNY